MKQYQGYRVQDSTMVKIEKFIADGWDVIVGNTRPKNQKTIYGKINHVLLSRVNSRYHGKCIRTIWAVK